MKHLRFFCALRRRSAFRTLPRMDKLTIVNDALIATGNDRLNILHDGSDESIVAENAFDRAIKVLTSSHNWPFASDVLKLVRVPDNLNKSRRYSKNGFAIPPGTLHVREAFHCSEPLTEYEIIGKVLSCSFDSEVYANIVTTPQESNWHPMAAEILTLMVEAACLRGLNEDFVEASYRDQKAQGLLIETRPHVDQQNPARNAYKSKIARARVSRRR